jgi:ABC-2 type transport system ATP-binding protein
MIQMVELSKRFGQHTAVDRISLTVKSGELFGFLGPNGAGKTTTIKMLAGLLKPTSGTAILQGRDILNDPEEAKAQFGLIPDRPFLYGKLTGSEFLTFSAALHRMRDEKAKKRISELLELFELWNWKDELIESYSHGMKQKLVMIQALLHRPSLLIVDEPMVGLDPKTSRMVKNILKRFSHHGGTVFLSTHALELAEELCNRIAIIQQGRIITVGTMDELRRQAKTDDGHLESIFLRLTQGLEEKALDRIWDQD